MGSPRHRPSASAARQPENQQQDRIARRAGAFSFERVVGGYAPASFRADRAAATARSKPASLARTLVYYPVVAQQYSIDHARRHLSRLIEELESGGAEVQLTRKDRPVAVLISMSEYARINARRNSFSLVYGEFHDKYPDVAPGIGPRYFRSLRDRAHGRPVKL
jgi:prevent-host-death family protein